MLPSRTRVFSRCNVAQIRTELSYYGESYVAHGNQGKGIVETPDNGGSLIERQDQCFCGKHDA